MDWLGWMWNDLPTRVSGAGVVIYLAASVALLRWISWHYVSSAATEWRLTTWEETEDAELQEVRGGRWTGRPGVIRVSSAELQYQLAIRGWDQGALARESGVSEATISRAMAGRSIRGMSALRVAQALRRTQPVPELLSIIPLPETTVASA